jgi:16S rRNA (guanine(966)-N(2))-methyltransferase RsmD
MRRKQTQAEVSDRGESELRIVGGSLRGRKLAYSGDPRTRPMKDRLREALFNLIGPAARGKHAIDLFAGTGALGFEAISRGAADATFVERHFPTADVIRKNAADLGVEQLCTIMPANTLLWSKRLPDLPQGEWLVFCSPPYDFYAEQKIEMLALLETLVGKAKAGSIFCVEADDRFDFARLPHAEEWKVRAYSPAVLGLWTKGSD